MAQKPSGAANRRRKKEEEARARAEHAARVKAGLEGGRQDGRIPPCGDPTRAHLWCVERLTDEMHDVLTDEELDREKRWKIVAEFARAIGMLQTKADLEREVEQLRVDLERAQDELRAAKERVR